MWARICEVHLGIWLVISPLIFRGTDRAGEFVAIDLTVGTAVCVLALVSFWRRLAWAHLVTLGLAACLALYAYFAYERPGPPAAQNEITIACLLLLFALVPNEATLPPPAWRERG